MKTTLRLFVLVIATLCALTLAEGGYSLLTGHSLVSRLLSGGASASQETRTGLFDEERIDAAKLTPGPRATHPDPEIGFTMKWRHESKIVQAMASTDARGQRKRAGPAPETGATKIVVLGDSVAFGFGVTDDQTFAHHLEAHLGRSMAEGPRPVVHTIGCPAWNNRAQVRFMLSSLEHYDPDIVVMMPVANDLDDQPHLNELGRQEFGFDPARGSNKPFVDQGQYWRGWTRATKTLPRKALFDITSQGMPFFTVNQITYQATAPESLRRWSAAIDRTSDLFERLERRGTKMVFAYRYLHPFEATFDLLFRRRHPNAAALYFFPTGLKEDRLETDSHPNARFTNAGGLLIAKKLIELAWVPRAGTKPLPGLDPKWEARRIERAPTVAELEQLMKVYVDRWMEFNRSAIEFETMEGFQQVYGGIHVSGEVGRSMLVALKRNGESHVEVDLERLPAATEIYPLQLTLTCNGKRGESIEIPAPTGSDRAHTIRFALPEATPKSGMIDLQIDASTWITRAVNRKSAMLAWRFLSMRLTSD